MITRQANPINDMQVIETLKNMGKNGDLFSGSFPSPAGEWRQEFLRCFENWRPQSGESCVLGLGGWHPFVTQGTTEAFNNFEINWPDRETFVLKGEYPYHSMVGAKMVKNFKDIPKSAKVIISYPFAASGGVAEDFEALLIHCSDQENPVLLDCALCHISTLPAIDVGKYPCIQWVAFSLSKSFASGRFRAGVLYSQQPVRDIPLAVLNDWSYLNHLSLDIHIRLLNEFSWDYMLKKYKKYQQRVCEKLSIKPSPCVLFGLSEDSRYDEFVRSNGVRRLCLSSLLMEEVHGEQCER